MPMAHGQCPRSLPTVSLYVWARMVGNQELGKPQISRPRGAVQHRKSVLSAGVNIRALSEKERGVLVWFLPREEERRQAFRIAVVIDICSGRDKKCQHGTIRTPDGDVDGRESVRRAFVDESRIFAQHHSHGVKASKSNRSDEIQFRAHRQEFVRESVKAILSREQKQRVVSTESSMKQMGILPHQLKRKFLLTILD